MNVLKTLELEFSTHEKLLIQTLCPEPKRLFDKISDTLLGRKEHDADDLMKELARIPGSTRFNAQYESDQRDMLIKMIKKVEEQEYDEDDDF